jgi:hypothetical protein
MWNPLTGAPACGIVHVLSGRWIKFPLSYATCIEEMEAHPEDDLALTLRMFEV